MSNNVVRIIVDEYGVKQRKKWCLIDPGNKQGSATLCTAEFFGLGESSCVYETKIGNITCHNCIEKIRIYKSIKI